VILCNGGEGLRKSIDISDEDHPVAGQIIGSDADTMARAAGIMHRAGYDVVDLNYACPVKKIKNKARGGHMLKDVARGIEILKAVRDALPPSATTTISLRKGFDDQPGSEERFFELVEAGVGERVRGRPGPRPDGRAEVRRGGRLGVPAAGEAAVPGPHDPWQR
jgi:tRNA-dihydrouridine synthase